MRIILVFLVCLLISGCIHYQEDTQKFGYHMIVQHDLFGSSIDHVRWSPDGKHISYLKNGELWVYDFKKDKSALIIDQYLIFDSDWIDSSQIIFERSVESRIITLNNMLSIYNVSTRSIQDIIREEGILKIDFIKNKMYFTYDEGIKVYDIFKQKNMQLDWFYQVENVRDIKISPKGNKIAFLNGSEVNYSSTQNPNIFKVYDTRSEQVQKDEQLSTFDVYSYCWSPDESYITFTGHKSEQKYEEQSINVYHYKLGSNTDPKLLMRDVNAAECEWSPKGDRLIFIRAGDPSKEDIMLYKLSE